MTKERLKRRLQALEGHGKPPGPGPVYHCTSMAEFEHLYAHPEQWPAHVRLLLPPVFDDPEAWEAWARDYESRRAHE